MDDNGKAADPPPFSRLLRSTASCDRFRDRIGCQGTDSSFEEKAPSSRGSIRPLASFFSDKPMVEACTHRDRNPGPFVLKLPPCDEALSPLREILPRFFPGAGRVFETPGSLKMTGSCRAALSAPGLRWEAPTSKSSKAGKWLPQVRTPEVGDSVDVMRNSLPNS